MNIDDDDDDDDDDGDDDGDGDGDGDGDDDDDDAHIRRPPGHTAVGQSVTCLVVLRLNAKWFFLVLLF